MQECVERWQEKIFILGTNKYYAPVYKIQSQCLPDFLDSVR